MQIGFCRDQRRLEPRRVLGFADKERNSLGLLCRRGRVCRHDCCCCFAETLLQIVVNLVSPDLARLSLSNHMKKAEDRFCRNSCGAAVGRETTLSLLPSLLRARPDQ